MLEICIGYKTSLIYQKMWKCKKMLLKNSSSIQNTDLDFGTEGPNLNWCAHVTVHLLHVSTDVLRLHTCTHESRVTQTCVQRAMDEGHCSFSRHTQASGRLLQEESGSQEVGLGTECREFLLRQEGEEEGGLSLFSEEWLALLSRRSGAQEFEWQRCYWQADSRWPL